MSPIPTTARMRCRVETARRQSFDPNVWKHVAKPFGERQRVGQSRYRSVFVPACFIERRPIMRGRQEAWLACQVDWNSYSSREYTAATELSRTTLWRAPLRDSEAHSVLVRTSALLFGCRQQAGWCRLSLAHRSAPAAGKTSRMARRYLTIECPSPKCRAHSPSSRE